MTEEEILEALAEVRGNRRKAPEKKEKLATARKPAATAVKKMSKDDKKALLKLLLESE